MINQGNLLGTGVGISEAFFRKLNVGYARLARIKVETAAKGMGMSKLGLTELFTLSLDGIDTLFDVHAMVIEELSGHINLGASFLKQSAA